VSGPVAIVSGDFVRTGGQDRANHALAEHLASIGVPTHLVAFRVADDLARRPGVTVHAVGKPLGLDTLGLPRLGRRGSEVARQVAAAGGFTIGNGGSCVVAEVSWSHYVHAAYEPTWPGPWWRAAVARRTRRRSLAEERQAYHHATLVIANSRRTRDDLVRCVGIDEARIRVVYYGSDPDTFHPASPRERETLRERLSLPSDRAVALFIGAMGDRRKGFDTVFAAWELLRRERREMPLLLAVGVGSDVPRWQRRARRDGLGEHVRFLGFRRDVPDLLRAADLLVAPTRYEAYGLAVHEALCCGLPAITSAASGVAERYPPALQHLLLENVNSPPLLADRVRATLGAGEGVAAPWLALAQQLRGGTWAKMAGEILSAEMAVPATTRVVT
jgi:glycosyltransferase involved in cell wall biosynthesis